MEININPTPKQALAWLKLEDKKTKFILFGGGAGGGKSWCGCEWLIKNCLAYPGTRWFIGREELKRIMASSFITFIKACKYHKIPRNLWHYNGQNNYIVWYNGSRIDFLDLKKLPSDPLYERIGSIEYTGGWLEEAGEIEFDAFDTLKTRIGRCLNDEYDLFPKLFITCNPKQNWLFNYFYLPWEKDELPKDYCFIQSLYGDNPYTSQKYEEMLKSIKNIATKKRLKEGDWHYDDDPFRLFDYERIIDIYTNEAKRGTRYCIIDVAGKGRDKTVIGIWDGLFLEKVIVMENISNTELDVILKKYRVSRSNCLIDEGGVGFGLVKDMPGVRGFVSNASPINPKEYLKEGSKDKITMMNYQNLKTQCWFLLSEYVKNGLIGAYRELPEEDKKLLTEDLQQMSQVKADQDKKLQVTPKEEVMKNIQRSTDRGDMLMMRMWYEIKPLKTSTRIFG